jgi:hypothetical protein
VWNVGLVGGSLIPVPAANATQIRYRVVLNPPADSQSSVGEVKFYVGARFLSELPAIQLEGSAPA